MDQRLQFLASSQKEEMSVADLCRAYGISRPTAYRWINRYNETGPEGLVDRSSRPHSCSHATMEPIENTILVLWAISEVFRFEDLGIELITPGLYRVLFRDMEIGKLNSTELRSRAARRAL